MATKMRDNDDDDKHSKAKRRGQPKDPPPIDEKTFLFFVLTAALSCVLRATSAEDGSHYYRYAKTVSRILLGGFMLGAAALRVDPSAVEGILLPIVPPPLPPRFCVYASGLAEAVAGILLLVPGGSGPGLAQQVQDFGGRLVVLLLWCVFPANVYHAFSAKARAETRLVGKEPVLYARIGIQFLFLGWAGWHAGTTLPEGSFL